MIPALSPYNPNGAECSAANVHGMLGSHAQVLTPQFGSHRCTGHCEHTDGIALHGGVERLHMTPGPVKVRVDNEVVDHAPLANDVRVLPWWRRCADTTNTSQQMLTRPIHAIRLSWCHHPSSCRGRCPSPRNHRECRCCWSAEGQGRAANLRGLRWRTGQRPCCRRHRRELPESLWRADGPECRIPDAAHLRLHPPRHVCRAALKASHGDAENVAGPAGEAAAPAPRAGEGLCGSGRGEVHEREALAASGRVLRWHVQEVVVPTKPAAVDFVGKLALQEAVWQILDHQGGGRG
mmetsp:Transcript_138824/g.387149  ORF Transcript_138824/g.387149 Transcript_138824/m.387149 type:complete len:293 (+) Transcript_138824:487-1365(+)